MPVTIKQWPTGVLPLKRLAPADCNPRRISPAELTGLEASLRDFGLVQDIVWNKRTRRVVGGHQRLKLLAAAGVTETRVIVVDLPPLKEKALNLALNSGELQGKFTADLAALVDELRAADPAQASALRLDQLVEALGFGRGRLEKRAEPPPPPVYTWILVGVPTVAYGRVQAQVEALAKLPNVFCEIAATDEKKER
jgi:ParB-like chromosome segregation protein Spo0J